MHFKLQGTRGFTLIEVLLASTITVMGTLGTLGLLYYARMSNEIEQERARAHQIICQHLEIERHLLFTYTHSQQSQTIWDNGTPLDTSDDITGVMEVVVQDASSGAVLTMAPDPAVLIKVECNIEWSPPGRMSNKVLKESVVCYRAP